MLFIAISSLINKGCCLIKRISLRGFSPQALLLALNDEFFDDQVAAIVPCL